MIFRLTINMSKLSFFYTRKIKQEVLPRMVYSGNSQRSPEIVHCANLLEAETAPSLEEEEKSFQIKVELTPTGVDFLPAFVNL